MTTQNSTYGVWNLTLDAPAAELIGGFSTTIVGWSDQIESKACDEFEAHYHEVARGGHWGTLPSLIEVLPDFAEVTWVIEATTNEWVNPDGSQTFFVTVYEIDRACGGPEEGGWYFDTGQPIRHYACRSFEAAWELADELRNGPFPRTDKRYSVLGGDDWDVSINVRPGVAFPSETPRYE